MIKVDLTDELYKYLSGLNVDDIEREYLNLAKSGIYKLQDVRRYFAECFEPSSTEDIDEAELEKILDYYIDVKTVKHKNTKEVETLLANYKETKNEEIKKEIINSQLKDTLYLCLNYSTKHKNEDIQDIIQVGNIGLIEAIEKYEPKSKLKFKDYLIYYIRENLKNNEEKTNG